ncbi:hypothetical protein DSOL_3811 [Desulfosporosinus metallidurans]|uniref:Uncharacterized protein n=1 Tax=Desulfosporosinus metallidurans TaxID=1888891 RepID=A0A1Q8QNJ3_9FIRM|nr:hypothetical protein DSOL_3811 [Desulfosporosinus metallidurans]
MYGWMMHLFVMEHQGVRKSKINRILSSLTLLAVFKVGMN